MILLQREGRIRVHTLSRRLGVSRDTIWRVTDRLVELGLAKRVDMEGCADKRTVSAVELLPPGHVFIEAFASKL
ncbi:MAG: HTH domain-containing protein [Janthinobacterium lividum]